MVKEGKNKSVEGLKIRESLFTLNMHSAELLSFWQNFIVWQQSNSWNVRFIIYCFVLQTVLWLKLIDVTKARNFHIHNDAEEFWIFVHCIRILRLINLPLCTWRKIRTQIVVSSFILVWHTDKKIRFDEQFCNFFLISGHRFWLSFACLKSRL